MTVALPVFGIRRWRIAMAALLATMTIAVLQPGTSALHLRGVIWTMNHAPDRAVIDPGIDRTPGRQVRVGGSGADSNGGHTGIAPKSWVVGVKVAGRNGAVDVSTMLWAMHWVASYKDQFNIRVMNLSWGVPSTQDPAVDPIDYAVERLWRLGIVVVVAAGNDGPNTGTITKPGDDPVILTVGAYDDKQNTDPSDDSVPSW